MITLLVYHFISPCGILKWHITFPIVSHKSNHLIIAISIYAWLTQFDRGIDLGCSLLGRAKNRTWSYLRIYIYYCMLQMKKITSKKCSVKCILSVATAMHALFLRHTFILYLLKSTPGGQVAWLPICKNRTLIIYVGHLIRNWPSRRSYM